MDMSVQKRYVSRPLAALAALMVGVIVCMVLADASSAAVPAGLDCVASEGKINGRGSTFQKTLQLNYAKLYRDDFCGKTAKEVEDPAADTMVAYNYAAAESAGATGSGAGLKAMSCRTDAFAGTDLPYSIAQLKEENEAPGKTGGCGIAFTPPFQPNAPAVWPDKEAGHEDLTAKMMSFPIGGSSVTLPVNLTAEECEGTKPTELKFTPKEVSRILGGDAAKWNDAELAETNAVLAKCNQPITRIVRFDNSGTTAITKFYLGRADNERAGATCAAGKKWSEYSPVVNPNTEWPGKQKPGLEGTCSKIETAEKSGGQELIKKLEATKAGVGYADLADAVGHGFVLANIQNATGTSFQPPNIGTTANCTYSVVSLPGISASESVGLNEGDSWANNNEETGNANHVNATDMGAKYPICGLTFDMVYSGLHEEKSAITRLTADQRRTMYSYFTFILSSAAQDNLGSFNFAPLPSSWLPKLREGFQSNF
jgi:ABC-type phosphate transport system substrate-binding protein